MQLAEVGHSAGRDSPQTRAEPPPQDPLQGLQLEACIRLAKEHQHRQMIIHTTKAMRVAWGMYERLGFRRSQDLDFMQGDLPVFGFRLDV